MKKHRKTCFRNEIRRILIVHTLVPCIISLLIGIVLVMLISFYQLREKNEMVCREMAGKITELADSYTGEMEQEQEFLTEYLMREDRNQGDLASVIYEFLNRQAVRGDFYLFDAEKNTVFSTQASPLICQEVRSYIDWGSRQKKGSILFLYKRSAEEEQIDPMWYLISPLLKEQKTVGYSVFTLSAEKFQQLLRQENPTVLVLNSFYRIFAGNESQFSDGRGKLQDVFRENYGFVSSGSRWYYSTGRWILSEKMKVCTFYDCTFLIRLSIISIAGVLILGSMIVVMVYISAGRVADKKTQILSDVVNALEQVEKGNFNVSMDIVSGDEFETIGKSFNMMLGSIRHLLMRHEELAQENIMANMQILESQFNPHFLFNTLESIRYMIYFDAGKAEKMLIGLSKLLRYSIQNASDVVKLEEELEFADRYLQIMLCRYGKRLQFHVDCQEDCRDYRVPRMILQPIVENAIKYGYDDSTELLEVWIRAYCRENLLHIQIKDNGTGISEDLLADLKENLNRSVNRSEHIGLYNVNKRVRLMYGDHYGVQVESVQGRGTAVDILIPVQGGFHVDENCNY